VAEIAPGEMDNEGPFGEFAGYIGQVEARPIGKITTITHRRLLLDRVREGVNPATRRTDKG
jgi:UbiD family decarboxylase